MSLNNVLFEKTLKSDLFKNVIKKQFLEQILIV